MTLTPSMRLRLSLLELGTGSLFLARSSWRWSGRRDGSRAVVCPESVEREVRQVLGWYVLAFGGCKGQTKRMEDGGDKRGRMERRLGLTVTVCRRHSRGWGCVWFEYFGVVFKGCVLHDGEMCGSSSSYCGETLLVQVFSISWEMFGVEYQESDGSK